MDHLTNLAQECRVLLQFERRLHKHGIHDKVLAGDQTEGESRQALDGIAETAAIRKSHREVGVTSHATASACVGGRGREEG